MRFFPAISVNAFVALCCIACCLPGPASVAPPAERIEPSPEAAEVVAPDATPAQPQPPAPKWLPISKAAKAEDATLQIDSIVRGKVMLQRSFAGGESESVEDLLLIWVRITNTSERRKVDFSSWTHASAFSGNVPTLVDDVGNRYKRITFGVGREVVGAAGRGVSIYPSDNVSDAAVFELPVDGFEFLDLTLPLEAVGDDGVAVFRIFPADIATPQSDD